MGKGLVVAVAAGLVLCGCATPVKYQWVRTDGKTVAGDPHLTQQFEIDKAVCVGEMNRANMSGTQFCRGAFDCAAQSMERQEGAMEVAKGCMAQRGYLRFPEEEAGARQEEFRRNAEALAAKDRPATKPATSARR